MREAQINKKEKRAGGERSKGEGFLARRKGWDCSQKSEHFTAVEGIDWKALKLGRTKLD